MKTEGTYEGGHECGEFCEEHLAPVITCSGGATLPPMTGEVK